MRVNRGKMSMDSIAEKAIELGADRAVMIDRWRGRSVKINLLKLGPTGLKPVPPMMFVAEARLRREFKEKTRHIRSSAINVEPEDLAQMERIADYLSQFLGLPFLSEDEATWKHDATMHLSLGFSGHPQITFVLLRRMAEIGPRLTLSKLVWEVS